MLTNFKKIKNLKTPLAAPLSIISKSMKTKKKKLKILNYGIGIKGNKFDFLTFPNIPKLYRSIFSCYSD